MRPVHQYNQLYKYGVSIHASVKDATRYICHSLAHNSFNPRICKRCDAKVCRVINIGDVSIHASVKDATGGTEDFHAVFFVSIHASVKDATSKPR